MTFFEKFQNHEVDIDDIHEAIDKWHDDPAGGDSVSKYLGMSKEQYFMFLKDPPEKVEKLRKPKAASASFKAQVEGRYEIKEGK